MYSGKMKKRVMMASSTRIKGEDVTEAGPEEVDREAEGFVVKE